MNECGATYKCTRIVFEAADSIRMKFGDSTDARRVRYVPWLLPGKCRRIFLRVGKSRFSRKLRGFGRHVSPVSRRGDSIFLRAPLALRSSPLLYSSFLLARSGGTTASGICACTRTYAPQQLYTVELLFVCLPTNIEISSLIFNITGANATQRDAYMRTYIRT